MKPESLVIEKEKRFAFAVIEVREINRTANSKAKVVLSIRGLGLKRCASGAIKCVLCVERAGTCIQSTIAQVIISGAVQVIGAGLHCQIHDTVAGLTKFRRKVALKHLKFVHTIRRHTFIPLSVRRDEGNRDTVYEHISCAHLTATYFEIVG